MRLGDVKRVARSNGMPKIVAAVDFIHRQIRRKKRATFRQQAIEFEQRLSQDPTRASEDSYNTKDILTNGLALTMLSRFTNLWIEWCFDNKIDDSDLSKYK